tara:strand:+ start:408 stop:602 length:195 start_codon:yes stop_codon:yes gene_type:complete
MTLQKISDTIKDRMVERGESVRGLARKSKINHLTLYRLLDGEEGYNVKALSKVCSKLGLKIRIE